MSAEPVDLVKKATELDGPNLLEAGLERIRLGIGVL